MSELSLLSRDVHVWHCINAVERGLRPEDSAGLIYKTVNLPMNAGKIRRGKRLGPE